MKRIYILAPNDRFNYGDLLFPYILYHYLKDDSVEFVYSSTSDSDLTSVGGIKTVSYSVLYQLDSSVSNYLIIGGGESLFSEWSTILSFTDSFINRVVSWVHRIRLNKLLGHNGTNYIIMSLIKIKYNIKSRYPFTIGKSELPNIEGIFYNSVGNTYLQNSIYVKRKEDLDILTDCDYLSVRDNETYSALLKSYVEARLVPDSAILISEIFDETMLSARLSKHIPSILSKEKYIFFQVNMVTWKDNRSILMNQLRLLQERTKQLVCLCPIGLALGHFDQYALKDLKEHIKNENFIFIESPTIWDIMWLIKKSTLYIGTSLHGVITSMSFGIPYLAFGRQKVKSYIDTWECNSADLHFSDISQLAIQALQAMNLSVDSSQQKKLAKESLLTIKESMQ